MNGKRRRSNIAVEVLTVGVARKKKKKTKQNKNKSEHVLDQGVVQSTCLSGLKEGAG